MIKLLEVAFFQQGYTDWYTFQTESMFNDVDAVGDWYDYTHELPESELHYTTCGEVRKNTSTEWRGNVYKVVEDLTGSFAIYKYVEKEEVEND